MDTTHGRNSVECPSDTARSLQGCRPGQITWRVSMSFSVCHEFCRRNPHSFVRTAPRRSYRAAHSRVMSFRGSTNSRGDVCVDWQSVSGTVKLAGQVLSALSVSSISESGPRHREAPNRYPSSSPAACFYKTQASTMHLSGTRSSHRTSSLGSRGGGDVLTRGDPSRCQSCRGNFPQLRGGLRGEPTIADSRG